MYVAERGLSAIFEEITSNRYHVDVTKKDLQGNDYSYNKKGKNALYYALSSS